MVIHYMHLFDVLFLFLQDLAVETDLQGILSTNKDTKVRFLSSPFD